MIPANQEPDKAQPLRPIRWHAIFIEWGAATIAFALVMKWAMKGQVHGLLYWELYAAWLILWFALSVPINFVKRQLGKARR